MTVKDVMTSNVRACSPFADLGTAATIMWECDCGVVPVATDDGRVVGVITDRDISIAAATRSASPSNIQVRDVMSGRVHTCEATDDVHRALQTMKEQQVRRLPVVDAGQRLVGILSMNDLVARADSRRGAELSDQECLDALKAISAHSHAASAM